MGIQIKGWLEGPPPRKIGGETDKEPRKHGEIDEVVTQSKSRGGRGSPPGRMDEKLPQAHRLGVCQIAHPQARTEKVESAKRDPQAEDMKWTDVKCFGMEGLRPAQAPCFTLAMFWVCEASEVLL